MKATSQALIQILLHSPDMSVDSYAQPDRLRSIKKKKKEGKFDFNFHAKEGKLKLEAFIISSAATFFLFGCKKSYNNNRTYNLLIIRIRAISLYQILCYKTHGGVRCVTSSINLKEKDGTADSTFALTTETEVNLPRLVTR